MSGGELVAVITGGGQGIGACAGRHLAARGFRIHAIDLRPSADPNVTSHTCDVTDDAAMAEVAGQIGAIDVLIPAAGINLRPDDNSAEKLSLDAWNRTLAVNLTGVMLAVRHFRPRMRADGAIVTVSSVAALSAMPLADAYTASKGAIVALTRSWAIDYSRFGIRVNCVCPGPTDTAMMSGMIELFGADQQLQLPQQRMATVDEVGAVIAFLASSEASYVSGAIIPIDGGANAHSAGMPFPRRRKANESEAKK